MEILYLSLRQSKERLSLSVKAIFAPHINKGLAKSIQPTCRGNVHPTTHKTGGMKVRTFYFVKKEELRVRVLGPGSIWFRVEMAFLLPALSTHFRLSARKPLHMQACMGLHRRSMIFLTA